MNDISPKLTQRREPKVVYSLEVEGLELNLIRDFESDKWLVWVDPQGGEKTGAVVGSGPSRSEAVESAVACLAHLTANVLKLK